MAGLQVAVGFIERVAPAVLRQGRGRGAAVLAHARAAVTDLVDVVAQEKHQVEVFAGQVAVRGVIALFVLLTGGEGETEPAGRVAPHGCGQRAAHGAGGAGVVEAIPVFAPGLEPPWLDVQGMRKGGLGRGAARLHDLAEPVVLGDFPMRRRGLGRRRARIGPQHQPGPQHRAIGLGIARGHAQGERVLLRPGRGKTKQRRRGQGRPGAGDETAARGKEAVHRAIRHAGIRYCQPVFRHPRRDVRHGARGFAASGRLAAISKKYYIL
jgi:hypothetical protein